MDTILGILAESSIRILIIAGPVACILWGMRVKSPAIRHHAWTGVLIAMLLLPFLSLWIPRISIPLLPAYPDIQKRQNVEIPGKLPRFLNLENSAPGATTADTGLSTSAAALTQAKPEKRSIPRLGMPQLIVFTYLAGFCILMARLFLGMVLVSRLSRRVKPDDRGFYYAPCCMPLTLGLLRPRILMPFSAGKWDAQKVSCILIHEQEHARRRDPLVEWLALVNRALYWFHPLAWWLHRKLAVLAEQACDEAVIASGRDPESYAELLLDLARTIKQRGVLALNWGLSIHGGVLMKRIQNVLAGGSSPRTSRFRMGIISALCIAAILVPVICKLIPAQDYPSQNAVYLTLKAICAEDDEMNLNKALMHYREVLATPSDQRIYAAFAQFRIAQILLQKGNIAEAAQEFDVLARAYPEFVDLVRTSIAQNHNGILPSSASWQNFEREIGDIRGNRYHHNGTGSEFSLQNWSLAMQSASSHGGEIVILQNEESNGLQVRVWMKPDRIATADIPSRLRGAVQEKVIQRIPTRGYRIRPDSVQISTINGKQALSAIADYEEGDHTAMTESLAWIYTEKARVFFFARVRASEFPSYKPIIDRLVATAVIP